MTCKSLKTVIAAALALTTLSAATSQAGNSPVLRDRAITNVQIAPTANRAIMTAKLKFGCVVAGSPVEFPDDIRISNPYNFVVPAGTLVAYTAPFGNSGTVALPALPPGASFYVSHAVPGGITAGAACTAKQI